MPATSAKFRSTAANVSANRRSTVSVSSRAELLELGERPLEIGPLRAQLLEVLLLPLVLLLRERVDAAELLAPALEPLELRQQLVARRPRRAPRSASASRRRASAASASSRASSTSTAARPLAALGRLVPELGLRGAEAPQVGSELARPRRLRSASRRRAAPRGAGRPRCSGRARSRAAPRARRARGSACRTRGSAAAARAASVAGLRLGASRNCASSSSWIASAVSPANHSSPRAGS